MTICGVAGIGHLGKALTRQLEKAGVQVHTYHPNIQRSNKFAQMFTNVKAVNFSTLLEQPVVLLSLPAEKIKDFLERAEREISANHESPIFVNLSTLVQTKELQNQFSTLNVYGMKMIGHADYLYANGDGVFLTETDLENEAFQKVRVLFEKVGSLYKDDEEVVKKINGLAVQRIIETCISFEEETKDFPAVYSKKAMDTIFPNTMRLFREGSFDGFMLKIIEDMKKK